jgi:glutamine synthetase
MTTDAEAVIQDLEAQGVTKVRLAGVDIDGVLRGKYVRLEKLSSAIRKGMGFCDVVFGWDMGDMLYDNVRYTGWHTGYPDAHAQVELETRRSIPWDDDCPFFLLDFYQPDGSPLEVSPRQALRRVLNQARHMGYRPKVGIEFEFFLFQESHQELHAKGFRDLRPLSHGMFGYSSLRLSRDQPLVGELFDQLRAFDVGLEGFHTETGPGVYEAAIAADDALAAADKAVLFKSAVKEIAARHGVTATFMAKPNASLPGCSGHVHQSLWTPDGASNLFAGDVAHGLSELGLSFLAGQVKYMPEVTALFAPTINSYKRFVAGTWAPTRACWGAENRTASLRTISGPGPSAARVEYRAAGADQNPYLGLAAGLLSGLKGIEEQLSPPPPVIENAYALTDKEAAPLPVDLGQAAELLDGSAVARAALGDLFVDHFVATRRWEVREFRKAITDWEIRRYMEII